MEPSRELKIGNTKECMEKGYSGGSKYRGVTKSDLENKIKNRNDWKASVCGLYSREGALIDSASLIRPEL